MPEPENEVRYRFKTQRPQRSGRTAAVTSQRVGAELPRITRLMALAIKLEDLLRGAAIDGMELARRGRVSRPRITQILNLLHLAPDIQERLLWLPPLGPGREVLSETTLRQLSAEPDWERQRQRFEQLLYRRPALGMGCGSQK
jgi:hypothetical protein